MHCTHYTWSSLLPNFLIVVIANVPDFTLCKTLEAFSNKITPLPSRRQAYPEFCSKEKKWIWTVCDRPWWWTGGQSFYFSAPYWINVSHTVCLDIFTAWCATFSSHLSKDVRHFRRAIMEQSRDLDVKNLCSGRSWIKTLVVQVCSKRYSLHLS